MTGHDRTADDHWLTYIEAAELLGISPEAVRAIARRQKWPRQSANAVGRAVRILVPADRLQPVIANRHSNSGQWARPVTTNGYAGNPPRSQIGVTGHDQQAEPTMTGQQTDILSAVREMAEAFMAPVREQIADLKMQLTTERERADRAESRVRELTEQLSSEITEYRQVVAALTARIPEQRSWWRWRRKSKRLPCQPKEITVKK